MSRTIDVVSLYGMANAGVRARLIAFLQRLDVPYTFHSYFRGNAAGLSQFARRPVRAVLAEQRMRELASGAPDTLILSREASPLSKGGAEGQMLRSARHSVYDIDDALHRDVRGPLFEAFFSKGQKAERAAAAADVILVGNELLAEWASDQSADVRIIPTCVEPSDYVTKSDYGVADPPRLLWLGTRSGERYLRLLEPSLRRLHNELGARLTILGSPTPQLGSMESLITRVGWDLETAHETISDYDVGVMPLDDSLYERGKCAYKLLEYGAARLPAVASPVGVNASILRQASTEAPRSGDEWFEVLQWLLTSSKSERETYAKRLHGVVLDSFSFDQWTPAWRSAVIG